jgi:hypothetical protein
VINVLSGWPSLPPPSGVLPVTWPNSSHSSLTWMAPSSTAPMQSSNTGIKSARKSAWILKSSLPPLTEDAQSTYWRSWSLNSRTGSVRKTFFLSSPTSCQSPSESPSIILQSLSTLGFLSRGKRARGTINQMLTLKSTNTRHSFIHHGTDMLSQGSVPLKN